MEQRKGNRVMSLITMVYVSAASEKMTDEQLRELLAVCRRNNQRNHIPGMLLYRNGMFIQAIEGERNDVYELYDKIKHDARHFNVMRVYQSPIVERSFSNWMMGFNRLDNIELTDVPGYTDYLSQPFDIEAFVRQPDRARKLLAHFKDRTYF
jgi:hypothetical protein